MHLNVNCTHLGSWTLFLTRQHIFTLNFLSGNSLILLTMVCYYGTLKCVWVGEALLWGKSHNPPPFFLEFARTVWKRERAGYLDSTTLKSLFKEWPLIYFNIWLKLLAICPASFWSFDENTDSASEHYWPHIYVFAVFFPGVLSGGNGLGFFYAILKCMCWPWLCSLSPAPHTIIWNCI